MENMKSCIGGLAKLCIGAVMLMLSMSMAGCAFGEPDGKEQSLGVMAGLYSTHAPLEGWGGDESLEEIDRRGAISVVRVNHGSTGALSEGLFVARCLWEMAKQRGADLFVVFSIAGLSSDVDANCSVFEVVFSSESMVDSGGERWRAELRREHLYAYAVSELDEAFDSDSTQ